MSGDRDHAQWVMQAADCIHDRVAVETALDRIATDLNRDLQGGDVVVLCVMNGGLVVTGELLPRLTVPLRVDYLHATRYREETEGNELHWRVEPAHSLRGKDVLIVDDILDEGYTLDAVIRACERKGPASLRVAVLAQKEHDRGVRPKLDYVGLMVPDRYVFGYGMDYKGYWRNAPGIFAVAD